MWCPQMWFSLFLFFLVFFILGSVGYYLFKFGKILSCLYNNCSFPVPFSFPSGTSITYTLDFLTMSHMSLMFQSCPFTIYNSSHCLLIISQFFTCSRRCHVTNFLSDPFLKLFFKLFYSLYSSHSRLLAFSYRYQICSFLNNFVLTLLFVWKFFDH